VAVLVGVICQGVLGGLRVEQNNRSLAMLHGIFASIVFSMMGTVVVATSSYWPQKSSVRPGATDLRPWAFVTIASLVLQYVLGGLIRHMGTGLHEHLGMAVIVTLIVAANTYVCWRHGQPWVARSATWLAAIVLAQVLLGLGTWVYKFGLPSYGVVPVMNSFEQIVFRTSHAVLGILVMMTACMHAVRVLRTASSPQPAATGISNVMNSSLAGGAS
jgi:cytochrome c oxidase assembly protein subunit 15